MDSLCKEDIALRVAHQVRNALARTSIQDVVMAAREFLRGQAMRRTPGESIRNWTERFDTTLTRVGRRLHAAGNEIPEKDFLHPLMIGMLYMDASGLDTTEKASVRATSGRRTMTQGLAKIAN